MTSTYKNDFFFMIQHMRLLNKIRMQNSVYVYVYPFEFFLSSLCKIYPRFEKTEEISFDIASAVFKY